MVALLGCMVSGAAGPAPAAAKATTSSTVAAKLARNLATVSTAKQLNYYPAQAGWSYMWSDWKPAQINADLARAAALGATSIRVIVFPDTFGWPTPTATYAGRLAQFLTMAGANRLTVKLTLFDWWGRYDEVEKSTQWATALLQPYQSDARLVSVELKNEMNPDDAAEMRWARAMIPVLRKVVPGTPITVTTPGSKKLEGFARLKAALAPTPPDYYDYHYYSDSATAYSELSQAKTIAAPATLVIGEVGRSSTASNEGEQAAYLGRVFNAARSLGIASVAPWTLNDFTRAGVPTSMSLDEYGYGLYRTDGTAKAAAAVVKSGWAGQPLGNSLLNLGFDNGSIGPWQAFSPQFGTATWTGTGARTGSGAIFFKGTSRSASALPSVKVSPMVPVKAGQAWHGEVWARGVAATGISQLALSWFDAAGSYLGQNSSAQVAAGNSAWTLLKADAKAPANAACLQIHLKSGDNSGTVWFDDVALSVA
ncbi:cellulase family glycosylhydrolase [Actinoplanes sp. ATCC 53533]|uniref:cellulase family glycosylhydrolase n=1 Tax=Actinoplanes sp. ATCC 53533 TaxID=1288362 RepID=UPI0013151733|nr:cellulase family glycosylhydrolase [Actinoplanes sp. ATCC 53533]